MDRPDRAVLLLTDADHTRQSLDQQIRLGLDYCTARGYAVVGVASGLAAAEQMIRAGEADVIVAPSREYMPVRLEIATVDVIEASTVAQRTRRTRPVRRR